MSNKHDKTPASKTAGALDAPLTLPADQLELVAGGISVASAVKPIINGLIRVSQ